MRTQTKLLSLVITLLVLTILASPVSALDPDVPDNSTFDYFIEYGPYSTNDYGPYEAGWHGPVYNASLQYPLTDYEIDIDIDFSGNNDYFNKMGKVIITGYSGDNQIWVVAVGDTESGARRLYITCFVGDRQLANALAPVAADWSGRLKFVHSTPDNWELWVGGNLLGNLTEPDIGPLTSITVDLLRYGTNSRIIPGMSCDRIAINGTVDETLLPQPVGFQPFDINGNVPLNGVQITVYTCDPVTFEPGDVVDIFTVDYGDIRSLPRGYYCVKASSNNYEQVYSISDTRFSNVDGLAVALIPMKTKGVIEPNQPVEFRPFDINANVPLNGVQITVYTCNPATLEPGDVVDIFTVDYGDIRSLPRGYYCIEASLINYKQLYPISETRFSNVDGPAVALIPMKREGVIEPNQPVEFQPFDINGNVPLNGVQITVYTCDPVTFEPGSVVDIFTVDYGDIKSLPRGHYCIKASSNNYEQVYSISDTRFSNVDGPAVALIPMKREYVGGEDGSVEVRIVDVDTEEPLQKVRLRIYEALPNFQQGRLVRDVTVNSGDYISLPAGRYFAQASKSGYSQYFEVTNTRVVVDPPSPSILYIPMTSRDVVTPGEGSFLDQSIEAIANLFGVSFEIGKIILGMLLALGVGTATAKQLRGGAQEFGLGMLGGVVLGVLIGLLPIWVLVLLVLIVGLWVGHRYMSGGDL